MTLQVVHICYEAEIFYLRNPISKILDVIPFTLENTPNPWIIKIINS
jgi:hypothetical protein